MLTDFWVASCVFLNELRSGSVCSLYVARIVVLADKIFVFRTKWALVLWVSPCLDVLQRTVLFLSADFLGRAVVL